ncbi:MAG: TetR/AcrR family transcriptional regulator [Acidobacteriaceae bacterium]
MYRREYLTTHRVSWCVGDSKRTMPGKKSTGAKLAWARKPAPTHGPKPSLSADHITRVAIRLVDREGLAALTMQRLAREVGLTTMALYRYFPGKADVVARMIDSAVDPPFHFGRPSSPWNKRLKEWARRCLAIYKVHPWFLEATAARQSPMGPNELLWMEAALAMLAESGLRPKERHHAFLAIVGHVRGHATFQQIRTSSGAGAQRARELAQWLQSDAERYPILLDALRSGVFNESVDGAFNFGIDCILDGIRAKGDRGQPR